MKTYTLNQLNLNHTAIVHSLNCSGNIRRRLLDLGLCENTKITPIFRSFSGDPTAYLIRGTTIAIRDDDSKHIYVRLEDI